MASSRPPNGGMPSTTWGFHAGLAKRHSPPTLPTASVALPLSCWESGSPYVYLQSHPGDSPRANRDMWSSKPPPRVLAYSSGLVFPSASVSPFGQALSCRGPRAARSGHEVITFQCHGMHRNIQRAFGLCGMDWVRS